VSAHSQHGWDAKEFSDLIGPLRKYLRKQIGRPWNDVYSELSQVLDKRSLSGRHIWTHVFQEVERYARSVDGVFYLPPRRGSGYLRVSGLFVHPKTGILCWVPKRRYYNIIPPSAPRPVDHYELDPMHCLWCIAGIWYRYTYEMVRVRVAPFQVKDPTVARGVRDVYHYGTEKRLVEKHQLNRKELLAHKLHNTPEPKAPVPLEDVIYKKRPDIANFSPRVFRS